MHQTETIAGQFKYFPHRQGNCGRIHVSTHGVDNTWCENMKQVAIDQITGMNNDVGIAKQLALKSFEEVCLLYGPLNMRI
jgi:hypothetical protein